MTNLLGVARKYHMQVGMMDTNDKDIWLRDLDAREVFLLSTEFLGLARYQETHNINLVQ